MLLTAAVNESVFQIFEILIGFTLGLIVFYVIAVVICKWNADESAIDLTRKVYNSLLNSVDAQNHPEFSRTFLKRISPNEFESPLQLLAELIRRQTQSPNGSAEKNLRTPPRELLEPSEKEPIPGHLRPEIFYVLKALEGLELPSCWTLDPRDVEILSIEAGAILLQPGDLNDVVIVVVSGDLGVFTNVNVGNRERQCNIKRIRRGESYFSFTSIIEVLMNAKPENKYLTLRALKSCRVAKYRFTSFFTSFANSPQSWIRTIQVIMTRLQHCTLVTCNLYLGIGGKCIDQKRKLPNKERFEAFDKLSVEEQFETGIVWMAEAMGVPSEVDVLRAKVKRIECQKGSVVIEQNSFQIDMMFLAFGKFSLKRLPEVDDTGTALSFEVFPGDIMPSMQILTNEPTMCTGTATEKCIYFVLPREEFISFISIHPIIYLRLAFNALHFVSPFAKVFDIAVSWIRIDTGQALYRQGERANCMFIVMGGRLRAVNNRKIVEEYGRLDVIGMLDMAERMPRKTTVLAVRFSHLVCVPENLLGFVKIRYPQVATKLLQLISRCWKSPGLPESSPIPDYTQIQNLRTIAVVPASPDVPLVAFTCELYNALTKHVKALRLSSTIVGKYFEPGAVNKKIDFGLMHWLTVQEIFYHLIIYQCDFHQTSWTRRCLRMADAILVVAMGKSSRRAQVLAEQLMSCNEKGIRQSKELVLLWTEDTMAPSGTAEWMAAQYYSGCHHLRAPKRLFNWCSNAEIASEERIIQFYENEVFGSIDTRSDFARLARILTGNAVGVVFGGGGARGAAHAGALKALLEKNVPIDMVGGTSIGAFFAAMYASTPDTRAVDRMRDFFEDRSRNNIIDVLMDLTYTHSALLTGYRFNKAVERILGDRQIEDAWISYFCITTDITTSNMRVHRSGVMWPYVRGSMSIAGYIPPLCDPTDGHLLLDGAYVNNLPADVMRSLGANVVIAIDIGMAEDNSNLTDYGFYLSGTWVMFRNWFPFIEPVRVLNLSEIQNRLAYVCCVHQLEAVKRAPYCHYIKLPVDHYPIFNFSKFADVSELGYTTTLAKLTELMEKNPNTKEKLLGIAKNMNSSIQMQDNTISSIVNMTMMPMVTSTMTSSSTTGSPKPTRDYIEVNASRSMVNPIRSPIRECNS
ncbi:unnamed protein product [Caenorhabditis bovis]|uniref:Uncharacterized protein n=1 Tax=Caenorhabditis bovis TaxID=2654633 RepID=A0A8S1FEL1_9PELO|nr:unnamed protein product [Caenorhabditis bovis]